MLLRCYRWRPLAALLTGGFVLQASSCSTFASDAVTGLMTSVVDEFIRNIVGEILGVSTGFGGF